MWLQRRENVFLKALLGPLWLVSLVVAGVAWMRRQRLSGRSRRVKARVVSVGNLAVGGAGKTPVTIALARRLIAQGRRVAVLSRGYGRVGNQPLVVSDGHKILVSASQGGDEPMVLARALPGVPVLVGPDRAVIAEMAIERFGAEVIVLDDGFQHLRLARDLDIVLVDATNPFGNGHVMPRGPLRESKSAMRHADLAWITKVEGADADEVARLASELEAMTGRAPVCSATRVSDICDLAGASLGKDGLRGKRVFWACGLARPESFRRTLAALQGVTLIGEALFADHHAFTRADLEVVASKARSFGAEAIAITAKDAAKIRECLGESAQLEGAVWRVVHIDLEIVAGEALLDEVLGR